ncbi:MAG: efflux RND transporter periplasmic adaptor subunit [Commensalibacter sp.]|nr:efflux RND transporter periplasmic adaptor subunit [Commensalibacter sp.]
MAGFSRQTKFLFLIGIVVACAIVGFGIFQRQQDLSHLQSEAREYSIPHVQVIRAQHGPPMQNLALPGNISAWYEAPIYAQVSGYIQKWYKDYGADVKAGDVLATIDTPSLDAQYEAAKANLKVAETRFQLAQVTAKRWKALSGTQAVSQQEVDVQIANAKVQQALVDAASHEVARYAALQGFKKIIAPFDGVVTSRRTDIGDYVNNDGDLSRHGKSTELFTVADIHCLRVFVDVPQDYSSILKPGLKAELSVLQYPGKRFSATFMTSARAFNVATRTVTTELMVDNKAHLLWPGTFTIVHFKTPEDPKILIIPQQALIFRAQGLQVAVVDQNNRIRMHNITLGNNLGKMVQVTSGISAEDHIVNNPSADLLEGQVVKEVGSTPGYNEVYENTESQTSKHEHDSLKKNAAQAGSSVNE